MHILITGGAGFIGSHTADALIENGRQVRILDNLQKTVHPKGIPSYLNKKAEFIIGDVRNKKDLENALEDIDAVYHFAAYQDYFPDFSTFFHVNSVSTALIYEIIVEKKLPVKKVIVASSQAVMGEGRYFCPACFEKTKEYIYPEIRPQSQLEKGQWEHKCHKCGKELLYTESDESVYSPFNQYALSKFMQEEAAVKFGKRYNIPSTAMRYSIVQGKRQSFYNAYSGAMRIFALSLFMDKTPTIYEDGNQTRDFVNIKDAVDANILVLENPKSDYQVFNVGGGITWTVNQFYQAMTKTVKKEITPLINSSYRFGDTRHIFSDIRKLKALGWNPEIKVEESIFQYWEYLNSQDQIDEILDFAEKNMKNADVVRKVNK